MEKRIAWLCLLLATTVAGCSRRNADFGRCETPEPLPPPPGLVPTWHQDARPVVEARCAGCHKDGGVTPFPLERYDDVAGRGAAVDAAIRSGHMPPWLPSACCNTYLDERLLTDAERQTLLAWLAHGAPEGDPASPAPPLPAPPGLSRVDFTARPPAAYTPAPAPGSTDEQRCFVIDLGLERDRFVTGLNVRPGRRELVHHVMLALAAREDVDRLLEREAQDPAPGFDCTGGFAGLRISGTVNGWEPGGTGVEFPGGLGTRVSAGSHLLLNIHYSTAFAPPAPDLTEVDLRFEDEAVPFRTVPIAHPLWPAEGGMRIPAGSAETVYRWQFDPTGTFGRGRPMLLRSINLHMHEYARAGAVAVLKRDGSTVCLLQIDDWHMHWQGYYWLREPVRLDPGDQLYLECRYDNSPSNQDLMRTGKQDVPHDVDWGADEDMCAAFLNFTEAPR